jgi:hypothetical protein
MRRLHRLDLSTWRGRSRPSEVPSTHRWHLFYRLHAHPPVVRHVSLRSMHVSPQALPTSQYRQHGPSLSPPPQP